MRLLVWMSAMGICVAFWWAVVALCVAICGCGTLPPSVIDALGAALTNSPPPAAESPTTTTTTTTTQPPAAPADAASGITFTPHPTLGNYVAWSGADRTGWPERDGCNGLLYLNGKKCEWIPRSREWTGYKNALNPGKYYQPGIAPGSTVRLEIRDIHGKLRNPAYWGEFTIP